MPLAPLSGPVSWRAVDTCSARPLSVFIVLLAAEDSIANFFGTLTILFDKPFHVGERIEIDSYEGVVEDVGFRSSCILLWQTD